MVSNGENRIICIYNDVDNENKIRGHFFLSTMTLMARINMIGDGGLENRMEAFEIWGDLRFHCLQKASGTSLLPKYLQEMSYNSLLMVFSTKGISEDTRALAYNYLAIYLDKW